PDRLDGTSGVEVVRFEGDMKNEASFVLAGPTILRLPPRQQTTVTQTCSVTADQTVFGLIPLMHNLGVHFKTTVTQGAESVVLYDAPALGEDQPQVPIAPVALHAGDSITTECTYDNETYSWITAGHDGGEMCFSALLRFPTSATIDCQM
ncbi:MAG TPA: hypothetical protein VK550_28365, partial [Polyangiaceae bacterium]|nr:hypothetical protein [Polyangiaceae bacterium]